MQDLRNISNGFFFFLTVPVVSVTSSGDGGSLCSTLFIFSSALFVFSDNERRKAEMKLRLHPGSFSLDGGFDFLESIIQWDSTSGITKDRETFTVDYA